jgi:hypothetical protein
MFARLALTGLLGQIYTSRSRSYVLPSTRAYKNQQMLFSGLHGI